MKNKTSSLPTYISLGLAIASMVDFVMPPHNDTFPWILMTIAWAILFVTYCRFR